MNYLRILLLLTGVASVCHCANILVLSPMPTRSHYNLFDKLAIQLTKRGHHVTIVAAYKQSKPVPNLTEVVVDDVYSLLNSFFSQGKESNILNRQIGTWQSLLFLPKFGSFLSETLLESSALKNFLKANHKFDLVITECFLMESIFAGMAAKYKAPLVVLAPFMPNYWSNHLVGNPAPTSFVPDSILGYSNKMNFMERLINTVYVLAQEVYFNVNFLPTQDALMRKHFGSHLPPLVDIVRNTSLVLVNYHHSLGNTRPLVPNMIEIAGYHIAPPQPLPQDLKKFMDESKNGVIFFSLGSHLKSMEMTKEMRDGVLKTFARLKEDVLWKFEDDSLQNVPKNVKIMKWLPQTDLLAHPKLKLFITHGGLLSTIEAVTFGVPVVGIPILGDQPVNMRYATAAGYGLTVPLNDLNEKNLYEAVNEVLNNPKYRENAKRLSVLLTDQPMKPMDTAIYWIEYVIRHKGAFHMRSAAQDLKWYELYMLDVFGFLLLIALSIIYVNVAVMRFICRKICGKTTAKKEKNKKQSSKKTN